MIGVIPPETLVCAKSLEEEQIQFKQNLIYVNLVFNLIILICF